MFIFLLALTVSKAHGFEEEFKPLFDSTCAACHSNQILSQLDFNQLSYDLQDRATYRVWERVYDRLERSEMPPAPMPTPSEQVLAPAMLALKQALTEENLRRRGGQRTILRRLTKLEYQYTLQDLLFLEPEEAVDLTIALPAEADSGGIDTVAARQGISPLHIRNYLAVAQRALAIALDTTPLPPSETRRIEYAKSPYTRFMAEGKFLGAGVVKILEDGVVNYFDSSATYILNTQAEGVPIRAPGRYLVQVDAYPYRAHSTVTLTVYKGNEGSAGSTTLTELIGEFDLTTPEGHISEVETYLKPGQIIAPSVADVSLLPDAFDAFDPDKNVDNYPGEGIALRSLTLTGPLPSKLKQTRAKRLFGGLLDSNGTFQLTEEPYVHLHTIVSKFARRAFRRPVSVEEAEPYVQVGLKLLAEGRPFVEAVKLSFAAILNSPNFLFHLETGTDSVEFRLANRLSYFLWRSMPDEELLQLAVDGKLTDPAILADQVQRLFEDPKSKRFIHDFADQAFRLKEMHATTPDAGLYPEFDERLAKAMVAESQLFLETLLRDNLSVKSLLDADFTYLNRRLAEHYKVPGIKEQHMRRVELPEDSVRGGLLSQAAIHKITANGTTTSPVPRGNFVLANVLGQPSPPPPPNVGGLEPDIRGTTTIRDQLESHRNNPVCASCHLNIDPPGFAMESFDPIGGFREHYRAKGEDVVYRGEAYPGPYKLGLPVFTGGTTQDGVQFETFSEYQQYLIDTKLKYVARHFVSQLLVFATGSDIEFVDRDAIYSLTDQLEAQDYPMQSMIQAVVQSELFKRR